MTIDLPQKEWENIVLLMSHTIYCCRVHGNMHDLELARYLFQRLKSAVLEQVKLTGKRTLRKPV
jgi:hypothetical protein